MSRRCEGSIARPLDAAGTSALRNRAAIVVRERLVREAVARDRGASDAVVELARPRASPGPARPPADSDRGRRGLTLVEVLVSLSLVASIGVAATGVGIALAALATAARAEAVGLALASEKLEELIAAPPDRRSDGFDEVARSGVRVVRQWRVAAGDPEPDLSRLEVTARWERPELTVLVLVALAR